MSAKTGILYGVGVGPGDPDLITLKAVKILQRADVLFTASSSKNDRSIALDIARPHVPEDARIVGLKFPMTGRREELESAWEENAEIVIRTLREGKDAAFLTLGDCMTYSTFGYVSRYVAKLAPDVEMVSVPGVTSYQAAASRLNIPLVEGEESLLILSGARGGERLRKMSGVAENVVFLKAYKNVSDINSALEENGRLEDSVGVIGCGRPEERIVRDVREFEKSRPDYWTLILSKKRFEAE